MAVDTRAKRSSILGFTLASLVALPLPDTSVDTVDRVGLAYSYSGTDFSVSAFTGTATSDINAIAQSGTGTFPYIGAATSDINAIAQSGTGTNYDNFTGTATSDINAVGQSATGTGPGVVEVAPAGGGSGAKKRKSKYPRRVVINGVVYWVNSAADERALLAKHQKEVEAEALMAAVSNAPAPEVKAAKVRVRRVQRRIEAVDTREDDWLEYLRQEDEDILLVLH